MLTPVWFTIFAFLGFYSDLVTEELENSSNAFLVDFIV